MAASVALLVCGGCTHGHGLDEEQIAQAARGPDGPPLTAGWGAARQASCNQGDGHACAELGTAFQSGLNGVGKDEARATRLFWKACQKNDANGCTSLANAFAYGFGGTQTDTSAAKKWYQRACDLKDAAACVAVKSLK